MRACRSIASGQVMEKSAVLLAVVQLFENSVILLARMKVLRSFPAFIMPICSSRSKKYSPVLDWHGFASGQFSEVEMPRPH